MIENRKLPSRRKVIKAMGVGAAGALAAPRLFATARAAGRPVKIGMVSPATGPIAAFGEADQWVLAEAARCWRRGITIAGEQHPIEIVYATASRTQPRLGSDGPAHQQRPVDIMVGSSTGDTIIPVADQCEANGVPCLTAGAVAAVLPPVAAIRPRASTGPTTSSGVPIMVGVFADMWQHGGDQQERRSAVPQRSRRQSPPRRSTGSRLTFRAKGSTVVKLGLYPPLSRRLHRHHRPVQDNNCEIICGIPIPPNFATFWTQANQQGLKPKLVTMAKAVLFSSAVEALGDIGTGPRARCGGLRTTRSPLTGESRSRLGDEYTAATGKQWTQPRVRPCPVRGVLDVLYVPAAPTSRRSATRRGHQARTMVGPSLRRGAGQEPSTRLRWSVGSGRRDRASSSRSSSSSPTTRCARDPDPSTLKPMRLT